jgi:hypothetical protein
MRHTREFLPGLFDGVYRGDDLQTHLTAVRHLESRTSEAYEHEHMYECLGILDAKAQALLAYDAILMTAASIVLSAFSGGVAPATVLIVIALLTIGMSAVLCLTVVWVYWTDTDDFSHAGTPFTGLLAIRNRRTLNYRYAWILAQVSTVGLIVGIAVQSSFG